MSTNPQTPHGAPQPHDDNEAIVDLSKMSVDKRAAMEIAESAREGKATKQGFAQQLFMGIFDTQVVADFPHQTPEDKATGDALCEKVGKYLEENLDAEEVDASRTIPSNVVDELFKMGIFAMKVPKQYGGLGLTQVNYNRVMMRIASYCASTAVLISAHQSIGVPQPLKLFGTEDQKQKFFPRFSKHSISAFALTEPSVGSDPSKMTTTAVLEPDGKHYVINGEKLWCTNGPIADLMVVMVKTAPKVVKGREITQITALIVEGKSAGIEVVHRCDFMGIRAIQNGLIKFNNVRVPAENVLLGEGKGLKLALTTLNTGRLTLPAACTGAAKQCLSFCRRWGNERVQWGLPIGAHEEGLHKLSFIASTTLAMEAVTWLTSHWADRHDQDIRIEAAMAKLFCSEMGWKIVDMTMQMRGGRGYEKASSLKARGEQPYPVERMLRDMRINLIIEGTSEIMKLFLAREAMDPHLRVASDLLKPHTPLSAKMKAGLSVGMFYGTWYPRQWINSSLWASHSDMGALAEHYQYVHSTSHRLARTIFHNMAKYQDKLERKQMLLGHLMEIGTELFAMTATCSYARSLRSRGESDNVEVLADVFCREAQKRIEAHFKIIASNNHSLINKLGKSVLEGKMRWMEGGVQWIGTKD